MPMSPPSASTPPPKPRPSPARITPLVTSALRREGERRLARQFQAVRLSRAQRPDLTAARERPLVVYLNHVSWWDPLVCLQVARQLLPGRRHYAPIAASALRRQGFFARLGFFAVDPESARGARQFLELATQVLEQPDAVLWLTAGGALADPRERPVKAQAGLGHLAARLRHAVLLPLALEYPFWSAPLPEALARFGEELAVEEAGMRAHDWAEVLASRLETAQDELAAEALARDESRFEVMAPAGTTAGAGVQNAWRRLRQLLRRQRVPPAAGADPSGDAGES